MSKHPPERWIAVRDPAGVKPWRVVLDNRMTFDHTSLVALAYGLDEHEHESRACLIAAAPIGSTLAHKVLETATIETPQALIDLADEFICLARQEKPS